MTTTTYPKTKVSKSKQSATFDLSISMKLNRNQLSAFLTECLEAMEDKHKVNADFYIFKHGLVYEFVGSLTFEQREIFARLLFEEYNKEDNKNIYLLGMFLCDSSNSFPVSSKIATVINKHLILNLLPEMEVIETIHKEEAKRLEDRRLILWSGTKAKQLKEARTLLVKEGYKVSKEKFRSPKPIK